MSSGGGWHGSSFGELSTKVHAFITFSPLFLLSTPSCRFNACLRILCHTTPYWSSLRRLFWGSSVRGKKKKRKTTQNVDMAPLRSFDVQTIASQFQGTTGLKYLNPDTHTVRALKLKDGAISPPTDGWGGELQHNFFIFSSLPMMTHFQYETLRGFWWGAPSLECK